MKLRLIEKNKSLITRIMVLAMCCLFTTISCIGSNDKYSRNKYKKSTVSTCEYPISKYSVYAIPSLLVTLGLSIIACKFFSPPSEKTPECKEKDLNKNKIKLPYASIKSKRNKPILGIKDGCDDDENVFDIGAKVYVQAGAVWRDGIITDVDKNKKIYEVKICKVLSRYWRISIGSNKICERRDINKYVEKNVNNNLNVKKCLKCDGKTTKRRVKDIRKEHSYRCDVFCDYCKYYFQDEDYTYRCENYCPHDICYSCIKKEHNKFTEKNKNLIEILNEKNPKSSVKKVDDLVIGNILSFISPIQHLKWQIYNIKDNEWYPWDPCNIDINVKQNKQLDEAWKKNKSVKFLDYEFNFKIKKFKRVRYYNSFSEEIINEFALRQYKTKNNTYVWKIYDKNNIRWVPLKEYKNSEYKDLLNHINGDGSNTKIKDGSKEFITCKNVIFDGIIRIDSSNAISYIRGQNII